MDFENRTTKDEKRSNSSIPKGRSRETTTQKEKKKSRENSRKKIRKKSEDGSLKIF